MRPKIDVSAQKWPNFGYYWLKHHIFCFFFVWDPYLNCLVWEERQESKFGGSCADLHQTSKIHNDLFLHLQYQDFKTFELLKLIKNQSELLTNTFRLFNFVWLFIILGTIKNKLKGEREREGLFQWYNANKGQLCSIHSFKCTKIHCSISNLMLYVLNFILHLIFHVCILFPS